MTNTAAPVLLLGCGKMGGALLKGWMEAGLPADGIAVVEPDAASRGSAAKRFGVAAFADAAEIPAGFHPHSIVIAVKPQVVLEVLPSYGRFAGGDAVFLSIAAGTRIAALKKALAAGNVVRAMPNLPASIGCGISVACADTSVAPEPRSRCEALLAAVGEVAWIDDETLMDAVTAVSGSGPAYVFLLVECLAEAGVSCGLPPELAMHLARATVEGSGELLRGDAATAAQLRQNVTSPAGTTAAALAVLMGPDGLADLMKRAIAAATARSRELSQ